jgi:hypothetical protein
MPIVNSLSQMGDGTPITEEQIHAFLNKLTLKIHNILQGDGYQGAIDYDEVGGQTGHRVYFSNSLREMRELHAYFSELLANPEKRGDVGFYLTEAQPVSLVEWVNDNTRLQ